MSNQPTNSVINPQVRSGLDAMMIEAAQQRARRETEAAERQREELDRQASCSASVRQTIEAFRTR